MKPVAIYILGFFFLSSFSSRAQELEPRAINNLPVGTNFLLAGYGYAQGNILLDAALPIENLDSRIHTGLLAYVRSIRFLGLSSKVDVVLPLVTGDYNGLVEGGVTEAYRSGIGDLRLKFSFNFVGSEAMDLEKFKAYNPNFVSGISFLIVIPTGSYDSDFLINAGSNRWVLKPQWGMSKNFGKWSLEAYVAVWLFGENSDFLDGNKLNQDPLFTVKGHAIRSLRNANWMSFSTGYGIGGATNINGVPRDTRISTMRFAFTYALPVSLRSTLKFGLITSVRFERGSDYNGISLAYQYRWLNMKKRSDANERLKLKKM